jgi:hypothetical protein
MLGADIVVWRVCRRATYGGTSAPRAFTSVWKLQLPLDPLEARLTADPGSGKLWSPISYLKMNHGLALALPGTRSFSIFTSTVYSGSTS